MGGFIYVKANVFVLQFLVMAKRERALSLVDMFRAMSDRTRLRLLRLIDNQEVCVCYFVEALRLSQPKISRHLAYLRRAGLVRVRKDGRWAHYRLAVPSDPVAARILRETLGRMSQERDFQHDCRRMESACCQPDKFVTLQGAPPPVPVENNPATAEGRV
jgi:ArsR family transcriptional regulator